jgi:hypothetical protein
MIMYMHVRDIPFLHAGYQEDSNTNSDWVSPIRSASTPSSYTTISRSALHQADYIDQNINVKLYDYIKL